MKAATETEMTAEDLRCVAMALCRDNRRLEKELEAARFAAESNEKHWHDAEARYRAALAAVKG